MNVNKSQNDGFFVRCVYATCRPKPLGVDKKSGGNRGDGAKGISSNVFQHEIDLRTWLCRLHIVTFQHVLIMHYYSKTMLACQ